VPAFVLSFAGPVPSGLPGRRVTLPAPGGEPALGELAGRFAAQRPQEPWVAVDPSDGGFHVLVEGDPSDLEPADGDGGGPSLVEQALMAALSVPAQVVDAVRHPDRAIGGALATGERLLGAVAGRVWPRPDVPYAGEDAGELRVSWLRVETARLAPLLESPGADLDGVLGSAVGRALRDDLDRLGHDGAASDVSDLAREALGPAVESPDGPRLDGRAPRAVRPLPLTEDGAALALAALREPDAVTIAIAAPDPDVLAGELDVALDELRDTVAPPAPPEPEPAPAADAPTVDFDAPPDPLPGQPEPPVETPTEVVAEVADPGAEDGAGAELHVEEPWDGYSALTADEVVARLERATPEELAVVAIYERLHRDRPTVVEAAERALSRR
jgi:hypothetical protein